MKKLIYILVLSVFASCNAPISKRNLTPEQEKAIESAILEFEESSVDTSSHNVEMALLSEDFPNENDYAITIYQDAKGTWLKELIVRDTVVGQHYDVRDPQTGICNVVTYDSIALVVETGFMRNLEVYGVEISMTNDQGNFSLKQVAHGKEFDYGTEKSLTFNHNSSAVLIPQFQYTQSVAFVGGQDTREFTANRKSNFIYCDLEYRPTLRKKVRVWYKGGELYISANRYTKAVALTLDKCDIEFRHWGDSLNFNHLGKDYCSGCP